MAESLYRNKTSLEAIFRILDKDNSGQISLEEFAEACHLLHKHLPEHGTEEDLLEMCKMMDINKDGLVDLNEFLEAFRLCDQARRGARGRALIIGESLSLERSGTSPGAVTPMPSQHGDDRNSVKNEGALVITPSVEKSGNSLAGNGVVVTTSEVDPQEIMSSQREDDGSGDEEEDEDEDEEDVVGGEETNGNANGASKVDQKDQLKKCFKSKVDGGVEEDGEEVCLAKKKNGNISINRPK